jgi:hypothetical protein
MAEQQIVKPLALRDCHLTYLDALRESGETNMFGAAPYLMSEFLLDKIEARAILSYWMRTFSLRNKGD